MSTRIITYNNDYSIDGDSLKDLMLGSKHNVVGANYYLENAIEGDLVCIKANIAKSLYYIQIVRLGVRLDACSIWKDNGGPVTWNNNFRFTPLTAIFYKDENVNKYILEKCSTSGVNTNPKWFFHPRFHNHRWNTVIMGLVDFINNRSV